MLVKKPGFLLRFRKMEPKMDVGQVGLERACEQTWLSPQGERRFRTGLGRLETLLRENVTLAAATGKGAKEVRESTLPNRTPGNNLRSKCGSHRSESKFWTGGVQDPFLRSAHFSHSRKKTSLGPQREPCFRRQVRAPEAPASKIQNSA